jgi:acyl-CoA thioesterase YciA
MVDSIRKEHPMPAPIDRSCPAIRVLMMPRDTNAHGTIFGGVLLSYIDQAGAIEARRHSHQRFVTIAMDTVEFKKPVYVGDVVSFYTVAEKIGVTSIRVRVMVEAERFDQPGMTTPVTEAMVVYVATDAEGGKIPIMRRTDSPAP